MRIILAGVVFIVGFMIWAQLYGKHEQLRRDEQVLAAFQMTIQQDGKEQ